MSVPARLRRDPLVRAVRLLGVDPRRVVAAVAAGSGALGSAVALAAVSAWLIARASQMPPVMHLTIAAVAVRTFGISRGVLRYVERLVSHDLALRGMATLRTRLYERLAAATPAHLLALRRGDLLARVGADVDAIGDVVVRGLLPAGVAVVVGGGSAVLLGAFLPAAGLALAVALVLAGLVAPWLAARGVRDVERRSAQSRAALTATAVTLVDGAAELTVAGRAPALLAELREHDAALAAQKDRGARPAAVAAALQPTATGLAVLAALLLGVPATTAGTLAPVELAVVVLTPLTVFEVTSLLPAAAVQLVRSRHAARRVLELLDATSPAMSSAPTGQEPVPGPPTPAARLVARGLACGWPGGPTVVEGVDLDVGPGRSVAVVGPSGTGKTTLLLTLAGVLEPRAGTVLLDGRPPASLTRPEVARAVALTLEDAHVFDTTVLENLRVARGDVDADQARAALEAVGLGPWLTGLGHGLDTRTGADATAVSGGERRRLLLARALLSPARLLLLDEPTEHVHTGGPTDGDVLDDTALLRGLLDGTLTDGRGVVVVTHRLDALEAADEVIVLDAAGSVRGRGPLAAVRELLPREVGTGPADA